MDTKITEIEILIDKLNLLFNSVKSDGQLDKFEIELLKKYVRQLQEKLDSLGEPNKQENKREINVIPIIPVEKVIPKVLPDEIVPPVIFKEEKQEKENEEPIGQVIQPEKEIPKVIENPYAEKKKEEIKPLVEEHKKPIHKLKETAEEELNKALNVKLASNKKTLAERIHSHKAKEITSVIDLNDKLFFIKELFNGDVNGYALVLKKINAMNSFEEVKKYIQNELSSQFNFSEEESVERFLEVVKLKFE